jgi:hypothetical protein
MSSPKMLQVAALHDATTGAPVGMMGANGKEYYFQMAELGTQIRTITAAADSPGPNDQSLIANFAGTVTLTLPGASSFPGRAIRVRTITANTVISATSNVVPVAGGSAGTAILAATAGKWADLQSDGTNWQIMAAG